MSERSRYAGQPFLRFLECYVLRCIGKLSDKDADLLNRMTPKLAQSLNRSGSWHEIVEQHMGFSENLPEAIRQLWQRNVQRFAANHETPDPEVFAREVVDRNLNDGN